MKLSAGLLLLLVSLNIQAEPTPPGTTPTYTTSEGKPFTYYYKDGTPVPPGTHAFISAVGTAQLVNSDGSMGDSIFATKADAEIASNYVPDCSGAVFGPGGIPAGCEGSTQGASGTSAKVDDAAYDKASFELSTFLFGAAEIGAKSCTPAGTKMPGSLSSWWSAVKSYSTGEVARDKALNANVAAIQKKIEEMTTSNKQSKEMQTEAIDLQIEMVAVSIESLNGASGRIPLREKLLVAALASLETNGKENIKTVETYKKMVNDDFAASLATATAACNRKKKVKTCVTDEEGNETCEEKEQKDPVRGCEVAMELIPAMKSGPAQSYGETYLTASMPSTALNNHMEGFEIEMTNIMAGIPRSDDADYDWSTPMEEGLKSMKIARKNSGTKCPGGDDASSKEKVGNAGKNFLSSLGLSEDNKVKETFGDVWTATDNVIGQAAYRGEYFTLVGKKINTLLAMDRSKLQTLNATKSKLENYKNQIKLALTNGANSATKTNVAKLPSEQSSAAQKAIGKVAQAEVTVGLQNTGDNSIDRAKTAAAAATSKANLAIEMANPSSASLSSTLATGTSTSNKLGSTSINNWDGLSLGSSAMALAKKSLEGISKNEKKIATYISTVSAAPLNSPGNKTTTKPVAKTTTLFTVVNNDTGTDSLKSNIDKSFEKLDSSAGASEIYKSASFGGSHSGYGGNYYSSGSGTSSSKSTVTGYSKPGAGIATTKTTTVSSPVIIKRQNASSESNEEATNNSRLISQSIVAKKFKKKDAYDTVENDSLFQRVTKAYIRNYEKVEEPSAVVEQP